MNIAIIASTYGYTVEHIKPWVNSLKQTNFGGKVFVIVYNPDNNEVLDYLKDNNIFAYVSNISGDTNMATQRFADYAELLKSKHFKDVDTVISTDIRDVVFQSDPGSWYKNNIQDYSILATGEGIKYRHEDWNGDNLEQHFGKTKFLQFADKETLCSGIIAGKKEILIELYKTIYELSFFSNDPSAFIDQIFYNIAIYDIYHEETRIISGDNNWCANLGTLKAIPANTPEWSTASRSQLHSFERIRTNKTFEEAMLCKVPEMINGQVISSNSKPYVIVHQYDRYQPWKEILLEKYADFKYIS